jgi:hypothetical protein
MVKGKNRKNKNKRGNRNNGYYKLCLQAICLAWGLVPREAASVTELQMLIRRARLQSGDHDPEVPDNFLALIGPALMSRGMDQIAVNKAMDTAISPILPGTQAGSTAGMGVVTTNLQGKAEVYTSQAAASEDYFADMGLKNYEWFMDAFGK